jgi:hypothetical protein
VEVSNQMFLVSLMWTICLTHLDLHKINIWKVELLKFLIMLHLPFSCHLNLSEVQIFLVLPESFHPSSSLTLRLNDCFMYFNWWYNEIQFKVSLGISGFKH